jgi:hypothetical protein
MMKHPAAIQSISDNAASTPPYLQMLQELVGRDLWIPAHSPIVIANNYQYC